jgi:LacI family transcriptional regulator
LLDGTMTLAIAHPVPRLCDTALAGMMRAVNDKSGAGNYTTVLPFDLYTGENL